MKFHNPYANLPRSETKTVMVEVSQSDYYLIKAIRPEQATMSGVAGTLWHKLCTELRKRDICDYTDQAEFERFVATSKLIDSDCPFGYTVVENGELEQLRIDSANWQLHLAERAERGGGLPDGAIGGTVVHTISPTERRGETPESGVPPATAPVVSNVQKRSRARKQAANPTSTEDEAGVG